MGAFLIAIVLMYYAQDFIDALREIAAALRERDE